MKTLILLFVCIQCAIGFAATSHNVTENTWDPVVTDLCVRQVVLLGEDAHHGSGKTMEVKIELITRLIDECDFSAVFFESPVYEFMNYSQSVDEGQATAQSLSESIGGLWSGARPMAAFITSLHQKAREGSIRLAGLDAQFGANQPWSQSLLPAKLSRYLKADRQQACTEELDRFLNWKYDDSNPHDEAARSRLKACASDIKNAVPELRRAEGDSQVDSFMAENVHAYFGFEQPDYWNTRDKRMAENFVWHRSRLPEDSKIIVWCATIHAARTLASVMPDKTPLGQYLHQSMPGQIASIGFTAMSGEYGRSATAAKPIESAALAQQAFKDSAASLVYLNAESLHQLGEIEGQPIQYGKIQSADWSELLDGVIVLREEQPLVGSK